MIPDRIIELQFKGYDNLTDEERKEFDELVGIHNEVYME